MFKNSKIKLETERKSKKNFVSSDKVTSNYREESCRENRAKSNEENKD